MSDTVLVRGFAVPFNIAVPDDDGDLFMFAPDAFRDVQDRRIETWVDHDPALVVPGAAIVSHVSQGLLFSLVVDRPVWCDFFRRRAQDFRGCSPQWQASTARFEMRHGVKVITHASIFEISLCFNRRPRFTGTWVRVD